MRERMGWYMEDLKKFGGAVEHAGLGWGWRGCWRG